jgi:hypothetical protein
VDIDSPDCSELGGFAPNPVEAISRAMTSLTECGVSLRDGAGIDPELADHYRTTGTQPRNSDYPTFGWTEPFVTDAEVVTSVRTEVTTDLESILLEDIDEEWDTSSDLRTFVLNRAAEYGGVVSEEFVNHAVNRGAIR